MKDIDELDRLHAAATAGEWVVRSYQEPSGEHSPAPSWEVYDEDNLPLTAALHNAWPDVSARLRAAEAEVERLRAALDNLAFAVHVEGGRPSKQLDKALDAARAALSACWTGIRLRTGATEEANAKRRAERARMEAP